MATTNGMGLPGPSALQPIQNPNARIDTKGQNIAALPDRTVVYY